MYQAIMKSRRALERLFGSRLEIPVFIVGCGRSGTTILGRLLEQHPQVAYLNDNREPWQHDPRTDIWSPQSRSAQGQLYLSGSDVRPAAASKIKRALAREVDRQNAQRLVEKLPINSFRIDYIHTMFPDALFVHLVRNGIEVARSIERETRRSDYQWFGHTDYKWHLLADFAAQRGLGDLARQAEASGFYRGLLEWRLSVETALESLARLAPEKTLELRYRHMLEQPLEVCRALEDFIALPPDTTMRQFAVDTLNRRSPAADMTQLDALSEAIAGDLLRKLGYYAPDQS